MAHWIRWLLALLLLIASATIIALWLLFPWGPIHDVKVEQSRYLKRKVGPSNPGAAPHQIVVVFSVPKPLEAVRNDKGAGFINATLSGCDDTDRIAREVVTQGAGYFPDEGRVRALPATPGEAPRRYRYRAVFDDPREAMPAGQHRSSDTPRQVENLCFALDGGSM
ncbi:hypothetical protein C8J45_1138 [Sphingomonas sp. PP-CE-3G-477]|uniref:hypothetical protein n=1 Tax=Sphingomonas sp. PP-CE-3G-477 TaxID=2135660 RepID=UPI000D3D4182|nr:hypothetical protein [Sphingomonas sp. PP-CE-3G-477]PTQ60057.1 hypothetical protein C8J45_1138 [Sphingomonas sp. PP-CE-3G-477]